MSLFERRGVKEHDIYLKFVPTDKHSDIVVTREVTLLKIPQIFNKGQFGLKTSFHLKTVLLLFKGRGPCNIDLFPTYRILILSNTQNPPFSVQNPAYTFLNIEYSTEFFKVKYNKSCMSTKQKLTLQRPPPPYRGYLNKICF